jgi:glutathione S-transferase
MVDADKPTLGYWKIRGLAAPIRYVFEYAKVPYNEVYYEVTDAPELSMKEWTDVKFTLGLDFPNLPYLIDKDVNVTESSAVLRYVVNRYAPDLNGKTPADKARVDMLFAMISEIKTQASTACYTGNDRAAITKNATDKLAPVVKYLEGKKFIVGDYLTFVDLYFAETLDLLRFISEEKIYETYPVLKEYFERVCEVPSLKEFLESDRFMERTFNNKFAQINN